MFRAALLTLCWTLAAQGGFEARVGQTQIVGEVDAAAVAAVAAESRRFNARFESLGFYQQAKHLPLTILLAPNVVSLAPYLDGGLRARSRGLSFIGSDRRYILLAWEAPGDPMTALGHELAHLADPEDSPLWFREGLAEYLARLRPADDGSLTPSASEAHLVTLHSGDWIPIAEFRRADKGSATARHPNFYAQAWLTFHWLARSPTDLRSLSPALLDQALASHGAEALLQELQAHAEALLAAGFEETPAPTLNPEIVPRQLEPWEEPFRRADALREQQRKSRARTALTALRRQYPDAKPIAASLGALEMDEGRYGVAENLLAEAVGGGAADPRTRYRYSLLLLHPGKGSAAQRAELALGQLRIVRQTDPSEPTYLLAQAQAAMVAARWDSSARLLRELLGLPGWAGRAEQEFAQLILRRQQALRHTPPPKIVPTRLAQSLDFPTPLPNVPDPPEPPPLRWPPPGAHIVYGVIQTVECKNSEKLVVLRNPLFQLKYRIRKDRPAKLFHPPLKWTELPCGTRGWEVNIAYTPSSKIGPIKGDVIGILF